jgi:hypothetical protein
MSDTPGPDLDQLADQLEQRMLARRRQHEPRIGRIRSGDAPAGGWAPVWMVCGVPGCDIEVQAPEEHLAHGVLPDDVMLALLVDAHPAPTDDG